MFDKDYFEAKSPTNSFLKGKKPLYHRFWIRYIQKFKSKGSLLDLGCGKGFFLEYAEKRYKTYGIDISDYAIEHAIDNLKKSTLFVKDAKNTGFQDNFFDIITCFDMLEHLNDPEYTLKECKRILKEDGLLIVTVPNIDSLGIKLKKRNWYGYRDKTHVSLLSKDSWFKLLENNDFKIIEFFYDGLWDSPYFEKIPTILQHMFFKIPVTIMFGLGIKFSKRFGEGLCVVALKK